VPTVAIQPSTWVPAGDSAASAIAYEAATAAMCTSAARSGKK
jgi:hypothetical protein